ncbi:Bcr/CflA family efflux MFS transporter [Maridesulfovibrio salexigens]|uniref:Drug resistance transporter, Bcr/CflA subfamily n=1 Tax=Maridesulfovibrio salexigens (strain ATCC 14822 / DSM 2638 / NCIMB 8403 / VKM B-1763) TaxID=526222 RepID=C6BZV9_MARSD|nr:Bcr/CflA family efflux MFS transporter [Maridesulfovibrio salexigens]ACS79016.1 drug resistance transporter, Bcr/CflA subfamily [Maridesulfovibrio salexigens DSM 2638]
MPNFLFITMLAAFPALSTDMYLPALPTIQEQWGISLAEVNLSLVLFFIFFSFFMLIYGPLSDKYGRRPVLIGGVGIYVLGSVLCALSTNIWFLVTARIVQAAGAASASALSMALAKDLYTGSERQKVLAYIGVIIPLCPMLAPMLGSMMLKFLSWKWIFGCQAVLASMAFYGTLVFKEPEFEKTEGGILNMLSRYLVVLKNVEFTTYCFAFSVIAIGFFGFLAGSADIYIRGFGMNEQQYAMFFGFNAIGFMTGSFTCSRLCVGYSSISILKVSLIGVILASIGVLALGGSEYAFAAPMFLMTFSIGVSRPISNHMILETVDRDIGAASALLTFTYFIFGAVAMELISFDWPSKISVIGQMGILGGTIPLLSLLWMARRAGVAG